MARDWKGVSTGSFEPGQRLAIEAISEQLFELSGGISALSDNRTPGTSSLSQQDRRFGGGIGGTVINRATILPDDDYGDVRISSPGTRITVESVLDTVYIRDITFLQSTIDAMSSGGIIVVAAGNYTLPDTLFINSPKIELRGAGPDMTFFRVNDFDTDIISIRHHQITISEMSLQHSSYGGGTGNGKGQAGAGRGIVFEMEVGGADNYGQAVIRNVNILNTASWAIYDTGAYSMEDISYVNGYSGAVTFADDAEHPHPIWGYKTAIDSTPVVGIPVAADVSATSSWAANSRTITSTGAFTLVRVGNYVYDVAGDIPHACFVIEKIDDSNIRVNRAPTVAGSGVTLYFSRRTNCRITVDNVIDEVNIGFTNSGGCIYLGYAGVATTIHGLKTNNYSYGSFCAHNDTSPTGACTRGAVDLYGHTTGTMYNPVFQSPSIQPGGASAPHDDVDATMLSFRLCSNINIYAPYFEVLSANCTDGVDWRGRGEDTYGYRQYWLITGTNCVGIFMDSGYFGTTTRKLDPAWKVGDTYYAGFPARILRTLNDAGGFEFTMKGGRIAHWREFYSGIFGHPTPPAPFAYGDFYPVPEHGTDVNNPWDDDDFLFQGTSDGSITQPILIQDLAIPNYNTGRRREPTYPTGTAISNGAAFRIENNGRNMKLGIWTDVFAGTGGTETMDNASIRTSFSQDFKGGMIGYVNGLGDGDGSVQREGWWGISTQDHNWKQIPWIRKHPSMWSPVYAGDMWMELTNAVAKVYTSALFNYYDGTNHRTLVGIPRFTTAAGDLIYYAGVNNPVRLGIGSAGQVLKVSGGLPVWSTDLGVTDGDKGDITVTGSGATFTIDDGVVTLAKMADMPTDNLIGRDSGGPDAPEYISVGGGIEFTGAQAIRRSALTGDVTASAGSNATTIANDAVTYAKMQNVSSADRLLGRGNGGGSGDVQEISLGTGLSMSGTTLNAAATAINMSRSIWLPEAQFQGLTHAVLGTAPNAIPRLELVTGATSNIETTFVVPADIDTGSSYSLVMYFSPSGTDTNVMAINVYSLALTVGSTLVTAGYSDSSTHNVGPSGVQYEWSSEDITAAVNANIAAGAIIRLSIERAGPDGNGDNMLFHGCLFSYTAA